MRSRIVVALAFAAAALKCGPAPEYCGKEICTKEQRCSPEKTCVTDGKPLLVLDLPVDMQKVTTDKIEVRGNAKDDDVPPSVEVTTDQTTWIPVKLANDGAFVIEMMPVPKIDGSTSTLIVRARDSKGQEAKISRVLDIDNTPPTCSILSPADNGTTTATGNFAIKLKAGDGSLTLLNPRISLDGAMTFGTPTGDSGLYDYTWALPVENGGAHELVWRIDDGSGHSCEARANVFVDNVKPTIAFGTPAPNSLLGPPFFISGGNFTGSASDGARMLKSVTLDFMDGVGPRPATINFAAGTWTVQTAAPPGDDYKTHVVMAVATDLADNTASVQLSVIVDVKPPSLVITSPTAGQKFNITNFQSTNNAPLAWSLFDGDPMLNIVLVQPDGGTVAPPAVPTSATDNPKTYSPVLRANDRAGNASTATVTFTVDRVAPTVTGYTPANNTRMHPGIVTADFSEVMIGGAGISLQPQVAGAWTTPQHFEISGLAKDAVYQGTTGMATDQHGNPVVPINFRFHTETKVPASGAVLGLNHNAVIDAQADAEGILNVLAQNNANSSIDWFQLDPVTALPKLVDNYPNGFVGNLAVSRTVQADLTSKRFAGVWFNPGTGDNVRYNVNGGGLTTVPNAQAFIPTPAFAGEPGTGLAEVGFIIGGQYTRTGRPNLATSMTTGVDAIVVTDTRWELARFVTGGTESQSFGCPGGSCSLTALKALGGGGVGTPNTAGSRSCSIHGYLNSATEMTTLFRYQPGCGGTNPCAPDVNEMGNFDDVIADPANDGVFYGYNVVGGLYQVKKRTLSAANCTGATTNVGLPIDLGVVPIGTPRIVVIRGAPMIVFANPNSKQLVLIGP